MWYVNIADAERHNFHIFVLQIKILKVLHALQSMFLPLQTKWLKLSLTAFCRIVQAQTDWMESFRK